MKFRRKVKDPLTIEIKHNLPTVIHRVEYGPKPKPTMMVGDIRNIYGEQWRLNPQAISGQSVMPVSFPIKFLTGRIEDESKQATIIFHLEY